MSINDITIEGSVGNDPDHRIFDNGFQVCSFSLANNEYWKDKKTGDPVKKTTWIKVKGFNTMAEAFRDELKKGSRVLVIGSLSENIWTDKNDQKRREIEIIAKSFRSLEKKSRFNESDEVNPPKEHQESKFTVSDIPF